MVDINGANRERMVKDILSLCDEVEMLRTLLHLVRRHGIPTGTLSELQASIAVALGEESNYVHGEGWLSKNLNKPEFRDLYIKELIDEHSAAEKALTFERDGQIARAETAESELTCMREDRDAVVANRDAAINDVFTLSVRVAKIKDDLYEARNERDLLQYQLDIAYEDAAKIAGSVYDEHMKGNPICARLSSPKSVLDAAAALIRARKGK
jgi:hypothetical protein